MGSGGQDNKVEYTQSPEQRQMFQALMPLIQNMSQQAQGSMSGPNFGAPQYPTLPSMQGVTSGIMPYQIPNTDQMSPTQQWWNNISPQVKEGLWSPYNEGANQMLETMGSRGQMGNARAGLTGAAGAAMGKYYSDASKDVGLQAWQMTQPAMAAGWSEQLAQNKLGYNNQMQERLTDYQNQTNQQMGNYNTSMQAWQMPYGLTGMMPSTYSTGMVTPQSSTNWAGMGSGAALGGLTGYMATSNPLGAVLGGIGGGLGGK